MLRQHRPDLPEHDPAHAHQSRHRVFAMPASSRGIGTYGEHGAGPAVPRDPHQPRRSTVEVGRFLSSGRSFCPHHHAFFFDVGSRRSCSWRPPRPRHPRFHAFLGGWIGRRAGRAAPRQSGVSALVGSKRSCSWRPPHPRQPRVSALLGGWIGLCGPGLPASTRHFSPCGEHKIIFRAPAAPTSTQVYGPSGGLDRAAARAGSPASTRHFRHCGEHKILSLAPAAPTSTQVYGPSGGLDRAAGRAGSPASTRYFRHCGEHKIISQVPAAPRRAAPPIKRVLSM